jgi:hypothetical protein
MANTPGSIHVVPDHGDGWNVKQEHNAQILGHFDKKQDAVDFARQKSKNLATELFIHGKDGKIQQRDSHGNDPPARKG